VEQMDPKNKQVPVAISSAPKPFIYVWRL